MKQRLALAALLTAALFAGILVDRIWVTEGDAEANSLPPIDAEATTYVCPMHPEIVSDEPGTCPICGMGLVERHHSHDDGGVGDGPPVVRIDPAVQLNLGIRLARVARRDLERRFEAPGIVRSVRPGEEVPLPAPVAGEVALAPVVREGQWVEAGELLYRIRNPELEASMQAHLGLLEDPQATEEDLEYCRGLLRARGLDDAGIRVLELQRRLPSLEVRAPHAGRIMAVGATDGAHVAAGEEVVRLEGLARVTVWANVFARDVSWMRTGHPAWLELPQVGVQRWAGIVNKVGVHSTASTGTIGVQMAFDVPRALVEPRMFVRTGVTGDVRHGRLAVPREALIRTADEVRVVVREPDGGFRPRLVRPGIESGDWVEILSGLAEGETVVVSGQFLIDSESSLRAGLSRFTAQRDGDHGHD